MISDPVPQLSVVVCSRNGADKIRIVLDSLAQQDVSAECFEVIVVDDGSTDATAAIARGYPRVRVLRLEDNVGLAAARNVGVRAARGVVVAFTDDDCDVDCRWTSEILAAFADPSLDGISGPVIPASTNGFVRRFLEYANPLVPLGAELLSSNRLAYRLWLYLRATAGVSPSLEQLSSVVGANMALRRKVLLESGGFDEAFRFGAEEEDLCRRLNARATGAHLHYAPSVRVTHWFEDRLADSFRRSRAYGRGHARFGLKHPEVRPIIYPAPVLVAVCALAGLLARRPRYFAATGLVPLVTYLGWVRAVAQRRSLEPAVYPYIQLIQELYGMVGQIEGARAGYTRAGPGHSDPR